MGGRMKILIAYDGSECADAALEDLKRAGLPQEAEAFVLTAADVFVPPPMGEEVGDTFPQYVPAGVRRAHEHAEKALEAARDMAASAALRVRTYFQRWDVSHDARADSPAWALVSKAEEWGADLLVVGAHGRTNLGGRLILGSVSQRVLYEAPCTVRVARAVASGHADSPARIVVGVDGSHGAEAAVESVAARAWPRGAEARLVCVLGTVMSVRADQSDPSMMKWVEPEDEEDWEWVRMVFEPWAERLRSAGLNATVELRRGDAKSVLIDEADQWGGDSIFVGAKGVRGVDRLLLGSVSAAVAARAHCSVEVVRAPSWASPAEPVRGR